MENSSIFRQVVFFFCFFFSKVKSSVSNEMDEIDNVTESLQNLNLVVPVSERTPLMQRLLDGTATVEDVPENVNVFYRENGWTPLMYAVKQSNDEVATQIADLSPESLNFRNPLDGKTALIYAIEENLPDIVEMLFITTTADRISSMANYANNMDFRKTPLMYALTIDDEEACINMMGILTENLANIYAVNENEQTVFQQAQQLESEGRITSNLLTRLEALLCRPENPQDG